MQRYLRPVNAFITFNLGIGRDLALKNEKIDQDFLGETVKMKLAAEPSDILWENRHFTEE